MRLKFVKDFARHRVLEPRYVPSELMRPDMSAKALYHHKFATCGLVLADKLGCDREEEC